MKHIPATDEAFGEIAAAAGRLVADLDGLTDADIAAPSRLPGWTKGHVLSHLARQAPALERLFAWARTGVETPQYADRASRDAEIEAGAGRPAAVLVADVKETVGHFQRTIEELPEAAWKATVRPFTGEVCTPERILVIRLRELEIHHTDLDLGYGFADIPAVARDIVLDDVTGYLDRSGTAPGLVLRDEAGATVHRFGTGGPTVTGTRADALAWLTGRSTGHGLRATTALPALPPWI